MRIIQLSQEDLVSLFEIRGSLEALACRRAARFISDEELQKLEGMLHQYGAAESPLETYGSDDDFHLVITRASRSQRLIKMLTEDLYLQVRLYRYQAERRTENRTSAAWREHREIVEALRARDPDRAAAAMERQIANAMSALHAPLVTTRRQAALR